MGGGMGMGSGPSAFGGGQREGQEVAATCMGQVQRLARAIAMYDVDYDDHLPLARRWSDRTYPYLLQESLYRCPARPDTPGYAFNGNLAGARIRDAHDTSTLVMLFDSSMGKPNAADTGESLCMPPRHAGANSIGYLDGHAILSGAPNRAAFRWR
jgi:prepilin-type processing-associated H-X9-DG protein